MCLELDFSHLGGKGIEIRSSPRCTRGANLEVLTLTDYGDTVLSSLHATALKMSLPTRPRFLGDFLRVAVGDRHAKSPKGLVEGLTDAVC